MKNLKSTPPKFRQAQEVNFLGGNGTIIFCQPDAGNWLYGVEMPVTIEPELGRVGYETVILVPEFELYPVSNTEFKEE